jgi:putative acetyltransferase
MDISVPTVIKAFSTGSAATRSMVTLWKQSKGDSRALVGELRDNLAYLDMVAEDGVDLGEVVGKLSVAEFRRLSKAGFNFNKLKKARIASYPSLEGTQLSAWRGKTTESLIESIYEKINELKIRYPHVKDNPRYRWKVRVNNVRQRIWLLLKHVSQDANGTGHGKQSFKIRNETPADAAAIEAITTAAFLTAPHADHTEHLIVAALRKSGQLSVSLVAEDEGEVVGHVAISPVSISGGATGWYGLGPISVTPARQGQGIGTALMKQGLAELRRRGAAGCVVLGDPNFYSRFGFAPAAALVLPEVPPEYFQAIAFGGAVPAGTVAYHKSFSVKG